MMRKDECFADEIREIIANGSQEDKENLIQTFYERVDWKHGMRIKRVDLSGLETKIVFTYRDKYVSIILDGNRVMWEGGGWLGLADISERMSVPVAYVEGMIAAVRHISRPDVRVTNITNGQLAELMERKARLRVMNNEIEATQAEKRIAERQLADLQSSVKFLTKAVPALSRMTEPPIAACPEIPSPMIGPLPVTDQDSLPDDSAVYFVWTLGEDEEMYVSYVGQSVSLRRRGLGNGSHHATEDGDMLSWLIVDPKDRMYVEAYYIGVCRPIRNFGKRNPHRSESVHESVFSERGE